MKFTTNVQGVDNGFIERLTAAANRKLAPKLKHLAARRARHAPAAAIETTALRGIIKAASTNSKHAASHEPDTLVLAEDPTSDAANDLGGDTVSDPSSPSPDGDSFFDVSLDQDFP